MTKYECTHSSPPYAVWREISSYCYEEAASDYCQEMLDDNWEAAPLSEDHENCEVFVKHQGEADKDAVKCIVHCLYDTPRFEADVSDEPAFPDCVEPMEGTG